MSFTGPDKASLIKCVELGGGEVLRKEPRGVDASNNTRIITCDVGPRSAQVRLSSLKRGQGVGSKKGFCSGTYVLVHPYFAVGTWACECVLFIEEALIILHTIFLYVLVCVHVVLFYLVIGLTWCFCAHSLRRTTAAVRSLPIGFWTQSARTRYFVRRNITSCDYLFRSDLFLCLNVLKKSENGFVNLNFLIENIRISEEEKYHHMIIQFGERLSDRARVRERSTEHVQSHLLE